MSSARAQAKHGALVEEAASRYRERGYDVVLEPQGTAFGWEAPFEPDFIARRNDETVAVEVASRASLRDRRGIREFAREVNARPGWRFELVLTDELEDAEREPAADTTVGQRWLDDVEQLGSAGQWEAAVLLAAAALEATLRIAASARGVELGRAQPREALQTAASLGYINEEELLELNRMWRVRNDLAHGFARPNDDDPQLQVVAQHLARIARRVLHDVARGAD